MSYKVIPEIPKSSKIQGRLYQEAGGKKVKKYAYSPFTAKSVKSGWEYSFYADVELLKEIESPPNSGKKRKFMTVLIHVGTYIDFRDMVLSGEAHERIEQAIEGFDTEIVDVAYWRNKGKISETRVSDYVPPL